MRFGSNSAKLTIRRRADQSDVPGVPLGNFANAFQTWCSWRQQTGSQIVVAGQAEDATSIVVRVNDGAQNRTITSQDRIMLNGVDYAILTVGLPERIGAYIEIVLRREDGA